MYLGISLGLMQAGWVWFSSRQLLVPAYTSRYLQAPSGVVGVNYRDFNLLHRSLLKQFPLFTWLLFAVSSVSNFCPDTHGWRWSLVQVCLYSGAAGREGPCKQMSLDCVGNILSVPATLGLPRSRHVLSPSTLLRLQAALQGASPELGAVPVFRYSTKAQTRLGLRFVPSPLEQLMPPGA